MAEVPALARLVALFLVRRLAIWCEVKIINSYGLRDVSCDNWLGVICVFVKHTRKRARICVRKVDTYTSRYNVILALT